MHVLPLRLSPGCDLRRELERQVADAPERSGFVLSGIGSLRQASLRFADAESPVLLVEPFEILSLAGSITPDGAHLHAALATASGNVIGGHLGHDSVVRTTAEILLAVLPEWRLSRAHDPDTGHQELAVARRSPG